jgi:superfamily II DNA/RNA helicase
LEGKDVILQGQTGSGKTLAYALPLLSKVDPNRSAVQAMVIVPTRELSLQIISVLRRLTSTAPKKFNVMSVMEGSFNKRYDLHWYYKLVTIFLVDKRSGLSQSHLTLLLGIL